MSTKENPGVYDCYAAAEPDEPMFHLLGRDPTAPSLVRAWASHRILQIDDGQRPSTDRLKAENAFNIADAMDLWRAVNRPERPTVSLGLAVSPRALLEPLKAISRHAYTTATAQGWKHPEPTLAPSFGELLSNTQLAAALVLIRNDIHGRNRAAGRWTDLHTGQPLNRDLRELLMLIVTELAEAMEGHRKNSKDDKLPHRSMVEVELADAAIRCFDTAGGFSWDLATDFVARPRGKFSIPAMLLHITETLSSVGFDRSDAQAPTFSGGLARIFWLGEALHLDVPTTIVEKMEFNAGRADHKREARLAPGGKTI